MFEQTTTSQPRSAISDWALRGAIAVAFTIFGAEKFDAPLWAAFFRDVGIGQWFRYFTGAVEILGAVLVLLPVTATVGLALLAATMAGAALIHIFGDSVIPVVFFSGLAAFGLSRLDRR